MDNIPRPDVPCADGNCDLDLAVILGWSYAAIVVVVVIVIVYAGIQYMISEGDPTKVKEAERAILYAIIGLIVVTVAAGIIGFVTGAFA